MGDREGRGKGEWKRKGKEKLEESRSSSFCVLRAAHSPFPFVVKMARNIWYCIHNHLQIVYFVI